MTLFRSGRPSRAVGAFAAAASLVVGLATAPASAQTGSLDSPQWPDFYAATDLSGTSAAGDLVRSEPMMVAGTVPGLGAPWQAAESRRLMYRSAGASGAPIAVSGAYFRSSVPWSGPGPRPVASIAAGTQGQGDQCAPSKSATNLMTVQTTPPGVGFGYEMLTVWTLLGRGMDVVMTDYEGLGTPGHHTYVDRESEAHAVLDAARTALRLPGTELRPDSPVVMAGYSQGGGAVAAAAELQPVYAPDVNLVGTSAAAPPADLLATLEQVDGSAISGVAGYAINGFVSSYPELRPLLETRLNPAGKEMLGRVSHECIGETMLSFGLRNSRELTVDGRTLSENVRDIPQVMAVLDRQRIGRLRPASPVRVSGNVNDDAVPYGQIVQLARDWCAQGATVEFRSDPTPPILPRAVINHMAPMLVHLNENADYLLGRVHGVPSANSCAALP